MPTDPYQLSPLQQGMLYHWLLDRHGGTDIEQIVADLREPIDPARLEDAWQHALNTFGTLRTAFVWEGLSTPLQRVEPAAQLRLRCEDLRHLETAERSAHLAAYLAADRREGFDLAQAPLMRVALFQMRDTDFRMVWTFHHILIDGRAFDLILNEVFAAYEGGSTGRGKDRPYRDYIEWVVHQNPEGARAFWRAKLNGFAATTPLPSAPLPQDGTPRYGVKETRLPVTITQRLSALAAREQLSLNTLVMSAWALLLSRYSGETDVVFGATKTTRRGTIEDADSMVGLFLATIPVRVAIDSSMRVHEWLKTVREEWVAIRGKEHLPLVEIRQLTALPPSAPLFETLVVFENYSFGNRLHAQGGTWANRNFRILEQTGVPLSLLAYGEQELQLNIEYDERRFGAAAIERLSGHLRTILEAWSEDATGELWRTPLLTPAERRTVLEDWNATALDYPKETSLAELLEAQVTRTPDAVAVTCGRDSITYRDLNTRANQLARELQRHGVREDQIVGVSVERSIDMMIALLAVVKAGGAYLPLDPFFPRDRLSFMMDDAGIRVLITQRRLQASLPAFPGPTITLEDESWRGNSGDNLGVNVEPGCMAYVIYTSGSTGKPKGVQVLRGALTNLLWSMRSWLALDSSDRVLAVTTISFDIAGVDVWLPWLVGAHTVVVSREAAADGAQLCDLLTHHDITFLQATPVTGRLLLAAGWNGKSNLQLVMTGEALPSDLAVQLFPRVRRLWNLYGPTETTIWSTGEVVKDPGAGILIGRPVANTRCYILDDHREPVPAGIAGELFIGGDGLARGYLNRPALTQEKFVPDPFAPTPGGRMYRTGDLARFREDGRIECLGRVDHQVKIRGFRIEPGEIEALLKLHVGVRQAVVVAREDVPGDKRLVAYVVPEADQVDAGELRKHLKQAVPDYMLPSAFVQLETIPLTASGKIDRRALPAPQTGLSSSETTTVLPRTHVEKQLSDIWEDLFDLPKVSVEANFFDLGGHSLLAVKLMAMIERVFGKQLPLNTLFESPTIESLARHIEDVDRTVGAHTLVSIQASGSRPPIYWIPGGAALGLFRLRDLVTRLGPDQPVYGLGSSRPASLKVVETVEERAAHYLELVRKVQPHGPYCFAGFCAGGLVAYEMAQRLVAQGESVPFLGLINCFFPRHGSGFVDSLAIKAQRLRHQLHAARARGIGVADYVREKLRGRWDNLRKARTVSEAARQVDQEGFTAGSSAQDQALLEATARVFGGYRPAFYSGSVVLFISQDESFAGVEPRLDPRFAWTAWAARHVVCRLPGGHEGIVEASFSIESADILRQALESSLQDRAHG